MSHFWFLAYHRIQLVCQTFVLRILLNRCFINENKLCCFGIRPLRTPFNLSRWSAVQIFTQLGSSIACGLHPVLKPHSRDVQILPDRKTTRTCILYPISMENVGGPRFMVRWKLRPEPRRPKVLRVQIGKQLFGACSSSSRRIVMPVVVLVRVRVIGNTANNNAREFSHHPPSFHLETEDVANLTNDRTLSRCILDDAISRGK